MYHQQMFISSASSPLPLPLPLSSFVLPLSGLHSAVAAPSSPLSRVHCSQVEKKLGMEALKSNSRPEMASSSPPAPAQEQQNQEPVVWVAEKGGLPGDGFSVDELLNLCEFGENVKEREENDEEELLEEQEVAGDQKVERTETAEHCCKSNAVSSSSFSCSSVPCCEESRPLSEISLPAHDAEELEWVSFIIDDSLSEFPAEVAPFASLSQVHNWSGHAQVESHQQPRGSSVATVHGASLPCAVSTEAPVPLKAKRSKRSRAFTVGWSSSLPLTDSWSTTTTTSASSCPSASSSSSSCLIYDQTSVTGDQSFLLYESHPSLPRPPPLSLSKKTKLPKKRGRKPRQPPASAAASSERRCSHCGAQKTPQWRAGPLGAKTLCNACGVRYKSGRLLPEYRPACSPTYVDSIHSSSHRKVLELRRQKEAELLAVCPPPVATC